MQASLKGTLDCIKTFSETDFTEDLKKFDVPTLIIHGNDDQIVPIGTAGLVSAKIVRNASLKIYPGAPHGLTSTHKDKVKHRPSLIPEGLASAGSVSRPVTVLKAGLPGGFDFGTALVGAVTGLLGH
jgi:fermentation-respiration switch protein FrsA (DUF1100 family)